ncbi:methylmalonyl-CoA mutase family protein, partial [Erythrobacter westpacificensis]|uniref:methylmalonyl-CoA mutase family protein n=1 Tax=Erythrobacter westpacificensis TaxID=1055231 RepID=UPI0031F7FB0F
RIVSDIIAYTSQNMPRFNSISISGYHMHEAGATAVQELAFTIADGKEYAKRAMETGLDIDAFAPRLSFFWGIGMNFFMEIAKMRAARLLWHDVMTELGAKNAKSKMLRTHCQTSGVSLQEQDPYNNVIRTTLEALSAVLGGTQSLHTNALDEAIALPTDFSARIARNTQLVIQEETGITNVADPLGGSYYIEALTKEIADKARELLAEVDAAGGMTAYVASGAPKAAIESAAAEKQAKVDKGETVIVGVNKYRKAEEDPIDTLDIDNHKVRASQVARIEKVRRNRDEEQVKVALANLTRGAQVNRAENEALLKDGRDDKGVPLPPSQLEKLAADSETNLLALAVEAARADATLGEISAAMEKAFGRYDTIPTPVKGVYSSAYEGDARYAQVVEGVEAVARRLDHKPRILVAKMGQDGHDRGANVIASAFADMGFEVISGPLFQTPEETAKMALEHDVDAVGASSLAAGHKTLIPELVQQLKDAGRADIKVVAGGVIPPQDYDFLKKAGVQGIYGPGTNVVEAAADVLRLLGHNMPPAGEEMEAAE